MLHPASVLVACAAALAALPAAAQHTTYCCNDENGHQVCSDVLPQACWGRAYREVNQHGFTTRRVEAPLTPEERAQREAEAKRKREQQRLADEERRRNQALLDSYTSEQDIDMVRERALREIEKTLNLANERYAQAAKRQKELSEEMEFYRKKPAPKELLDALKDNESELRAHGSVIEAKQKELDAVRAKYDEDKRRYIELTRGRAAASSSSGEPRAK
jgi:hypothetical protein